jgi:hypothetical protein
MEEAARKDLGKEQATTETEASAKISKQTHLPRPEAILATVGDVRKCSPD